MGYTKSYGGEMVMGKTILYLRTDITNTKLVAGGSVAHTIGVIQGFIDRGNTVVCASSIMLEQLSSLPIVHLKPLANPRLLAPLRWKINCLLSSLFFANQLRLLMQSYKIDFIYQRYSILNCSGILMSKIKKIPIILEYNGSESWVDKYWGKHSWLPVRRVIALVEWINVRFADTITVVSKPLYDELVNRGIDAAKIMINPNGVDTTIFDPTQLVEQRNAIRKKLAIEDNFVFCFVGTFSPWHGIELLASTMPIIVAKRSHVHFLFIGDGPLRSFLHQDLIRQGVSTDHCTFTGLVPQQETKYFLAAADAYVCPTQPNPDGSRFFGSPTKVFEYLSMGKPILASNLEQLSEIFNPALTRVDQSVTDEIGFLFEPTNTLSFINGAIAIIDLHPQDYQKLGSNARNKAIKYYQWADHVAKYAAIMNKKVDQPSLKKS